MTQPTKALTSKEALFKYLEDAPVLIQFEVAKAKITRMKFVALVGQGFSEEQALRLCQEAK